jgi:aminocarboxymuconate-semialdehyde decarboxylase
MLFSNVNGAGLNEPQFWPIYELANDLGATLYIHPTHPVGVEAMTDFWLMPWSVSSWTLPSPPPNSSSAASPNASLGFEAFSECRAHIPRPPSTYLKQFYFDTVNFNPTHQIGSIPKMIETVGPNADLYAATARRLLKLP